MWIFKIGMMGSFPTNPSKKIHSAQPVKKKRIWHPFTWDTYSTAERQNDTTCERRGNSETA
jgi:hypothetical protein